MTIKQLIWTVLLGMVVVYTLLVLMMSPVHPTSGSGEGNILTTQTP